jgi:hypothetical protein
MLKEAHESDVHVFYRLVFQTYYETLAHVLFLK